MTKALVWGTACHSKLVYRIFDQWTIFVGRKKKRYVLAAIKNQMITGICSTQNILGKSLAYIIFFLQLKDYSSHTNPTRHSLTLGKCKTHTGFEDNGLFGVDSCFLGYSFWGAGHCCTDRRKTGQRQTDPPLDFCLHSDWKERENTNINRSWKFIYIENQGF